MTRQIFVFIFIAINSASVVHAASLAYPKPAVPPAIGFKTVTQTTVKLRETLQPVFKHGECDWLPAMALKAGWAVEHLGKLKQIALRESGCCPNRRGGDQVDKNCRIVGVSEWNHRSDSGLLQNNGINWDLARNPTAPICLQIGVCTQEPLLDAFTNLVAGLVLYNYWEKAAGDGWIPWDICNKTLTCKGSPKKDRSAETKSP